MLKSLRSRLLASYLAVISVTLLVVTVILLVVSVRGRATPLVRQLTELARGVTPEVLRLAAAGQSARQLEAHLLQVAEDNQVRILLISGADERILFDSAQRWTGRSLAEFDVPRSVQRSLDLTPNAGIYRAADGQRWVFYAQPVTVLSGLALVFGREEPPVLQLFRETFLRPLCFGAGLALALALLLAYAITRSVARPLQEMATVAEAIGQGKYDQRAPVAGPEEVQRVATNFNRMAQQVQATQTAQRDFVANVSHDLRTPITAIQGWSQALLDGAAADPEAQTQAAQIIHDEAGRLGRMVQQLLELSRLSSGQLRLNRTPVDLSALLQEVAAGQQVEAESRAITLQVEATPLPPVSADRDRLAQVLGNLVDNALRHTPAGGQVILQGRQEGSWAVLAVADTGRGIPAEEQARIFERFYQVEKSRARRDQHSGAGLGLAIARELVEAHGGTIQVTSQVDQGSVFTIRLPMA